MNIPLFDFLVTSLAVYRVTLMVVREKGPGHVFKKVREAPSKYSKVYDWITCLFCFSMTTSALACFGLWLAGNREHYAHWFILWCAFSAIAIMIHMRFKQQEP